MSKLSYGPVLFNWSPETWRDAHFRIADEAPIDSVQLGEIVCSKRAPFLAPHLPAVIERLQAAGKEVILASPALVTTERERQAVRELIESADLPIEANDIGALPHLAGRPHMVGPLVNVYNEQALAWMAKRGATRVTLPAEIAGPAIATIAAAAQALSVEVEVQVFGRLPLAISARCYHARALGLHKDGCQFVCGQDADGMEVTTLDGEAFLAVNGTQTLSQSYHALLPELGALTGAGVTRFRLWPHACDMVAVARLFRDVLDGHAEPGPALETLRGLLGGAELANGYYHGKQGVAFAAE
ncbi:MAG: U32 family peptidase [Alphaproteobacteria bacterium]|nr:U32 family peptidase [Alphaproteobacteria bacterium]